MAQETSCTTFSLSLSAHNYGLQLRYEKQPRQEVLPHCRRCQIAFIDAPLANAEPKKNSVDGAALQQQRRYAAIPISRAAISGSAPTVWSSGDLDNQWPSVISWPEYPQILLLFAGSARVFHYKLGATPNIEKLSSCNRSLNGFNPAKTW